MARMVVKKFLKYVRIYAVLFKYGFIRSTAYRVSFLIELGVELGYQLAFIAYFLIVMSNVQTMAGWSYHEVLFLTGLNIVVFELLLSSVFAFGFRDLPAAIKDGEIDVLLLKPIHSLFNLTFAKPYFIGYLCTVPGVALMWYAGSQPDVHITWLSFFIGAGLTVCGLVIAYAITAIIASLCFVFTNAEALPTIAERITTEYSSNPIDAYRGAVRTILFFIIPVMFVSGVPAAAMVRPVEPYLLVLGPVFAIGLLWLSLVIWNRMIRRYSSASS